MVDGLMSARLSLQWVEPLLSSFLMRAWAERHFEVATHFTMLSCVHVSHALGPATSRCVSFRARGKRQGYGSPSSLTHCVGRGGRVAQLTITAMPLHLLRIAWANAELTTEALMDRTLDRCYIPDLLRGP
jgi:hypothetical protein